MHFRVGPFVYKVEVVEGYIEHEGERCLELCDNDRHELLVSDQASEAQQIQVICHEYMEAWLYHFGQAGMDKEGYCDLFGLAMTQFVMDLMRTLRPTGAAAGEWASEASAGDDGRVKRCGLADSASDEVRAPDQARQDAGGWAVGSVRVRECVEPARPGCARPWRVRIFEGERDK